MVARTQVLDKTTFAWCREVPVLNCRLVTLRELRVSAAAALFSLLTPHDFSRFISNPPRASRVRRASSRGRSTSAPRSSDMPRRHAATNATARSHLPIRQLGCIPHRRMGFLRSDGLLGIGRLRDAAALTLKLAFETMASTARGTGGDQNARGKRRPAKARRGARWLLRKSFLKDGEWLANVVLANR